MKSVNVKEIDQLLIYHISTKTMDIVCRNSSPKNRFVDSFTSHIIIQNKTLTSSKHNVHSIWCLVFDIPVSSLSEL